MEMFYIKEEIYQEIKRKLNKKDDYFSTQEINVALTMMKEGAN